MAWSWVDLNHLSRKRALQVSRKDLIVNRFTIATLKTQLSLGIAFLSPNNNQWKNNMKQQHESKKKVKKKTIETFSQTCFPAHCFIDNDDFMADKCNHKNPRRASWKMSEAKTNLTFQVQILHPLSHSKFVSVAKIYCA